ncbi:MAG: histidine kinase [bacterium]|nr:histidine kinase [bacterium]
MQRIRRFLRSLTARMVLTHILVAILTSIVATLILALAFTWLNRGISASDYRGLAVNIAVSWLFGGEDGHPNPTNSPFPDGFTLLVDNNDRVVHSQGDTTCRKGMALADCGTELIDLPVGERLYQQDGERWAEVVLPFSRGEEMGLDGMYIIARRGPPGSEPSLILGETLIYGTGRFILVFAGAMAVLSAPMALILSLLISTPQTRRLSRIAQTSRRFSEGDLQARVQDRRQDEVGKLAQQFDDMATALEQNIHALRDLAQANAELAQQAEQSAIQAERVRLSRDLHDAIAQRLFSLSVSTSTLPDVIQTDQEKGIQQARIIAGLAEHTLLDLRALLVELRPTNLMQRGLADAMHTLCSEWQSAHRIQVECSLMLTGKHLPSTVEDTLYRVTQEALSNVAKHAHATAVDVSLVEGQKQIILSISDSGRGFEVPEVTAEGHFGLNTMRERARAIGGSLTIESVPGRGTTILMVLPLERTVMVSTSLQEA